MLDQERKPLINEPALKESLVSAALAYRQKPDDEAVKTNFFVAADALLSLPTRQFAISDHAVTQYQRRSGTKKFSKATKKIRQMMNHADEVELKDRYKVIQLLNHDFKDASYYRYGGWILVVCDGTVITVHGGEAKRWKQP